MLLRRPERTTFRREGARRLRTITIVRTAAAVVIMGIVATVSPGAALPYYYALIALFIAAGWVNFAVSRSSFDGPWRDYVFAAGDFALLTFTLIIPAPGAPAGLPDVFFLRFDNFDYYYVVLASLSISLRPGVVIWGGVCGASFWCFGLYWLSRDPMVSVAGVENAGDPVPQLLANAANPHHLDLGVQFQGVAVYLVVSVVIAVAVEASLRLLLLQASQERRSANLSRYLPAEMIDALADRDAPFGGEEEVEAAILFTDIVGFSGLAERLAPPEVISLLRQVHGIVATEVFTHGGMLDKFIGDGAMATFGAARRRADDAPDAARAIACARAILKAIDDWNRARGGAPVRLSVGVHYGLVMVGDVGSAQRMELAVIGDTVNVASRLEEMTRSLNVGAAISGEAVAAAGSSDGLRLIGPQTAHGRKEPVVVWAIDRL